MGQRIPPADFNPYAALFAAGGGGIPPMAAMPPAPQVTAPPTPYQTGQSDGFVNAMSGGPDLVGPPRGAGNPESMELAQAQKSIEAQALAGETFPEPAATGQNVPRGTAPASSTGAGGKTTVADLINQLNNKELDALKQQGLSVEALKGKLGAMEVKDLPLDMTGFAALTDAWTGSNFAQHYKPEETARERRATIDALQNKILGAQQGMTESELNMLKTKIGNQFNVDKFDYQKKHDDDQLKFDREKLAVEAGKAAQKGALTPQDGFNMRATVEKLDTTKKVLGSIDLSRALNDYERLVNKYGANPVGIPAAELKDAYSQITLAYKNAGELGALSGPDMEIVKQGVGPAGDLTGWFKSGLTGGAGGIKAQIRAMRNATKGGYQSRIRNLRAIAGGGAAAEAVNPLIDNYDMQMREASGEAPVAAVDAAKAWLADPANAASPDRAGVEATLKKLGG